MCYQFFSSVPSKNEFMNKLRNDLINYGVDGMTSLLSL